MDTFKFSILFISLIIIACKLDTTSVPAPAESKQTMPDAGKLHQIKVIQTDYDSLVVQNSDQLTLKSKAISQIRLYKQDSLSYILLDSLIPQYTGTYGHYRLHFKFGIHVGENDLFYDFRISYQLFDSSIVAIDSSITLCQYPYPSAEVYKLYNELPFPKNKDIAYIDDIDYKDGNFYYRPSGGYGIYVINDKTREAKSLAHYIPFNYITVDSIFLFYQYGPERVIRQNLNDGHEDDVIWLNNHTNNDTAIFGMEAEDGYLYLVTNKYILLTCDYAGNILNSSPYPDQTFSLTFMDNKLYSLDLQNLKKSIAVFNLTTGAFENSKLPPSRNTYAICYSEEHFYYSDDKRRYIGRIPIDHFLQ
jgi:hypothetical protein